MNKVPFKPEDYFTETQHISVSAWKKYNQCESLGLKGFDDSKRSEALLFGSYVDAYVEGTLEKFKEETPDMFSTRGPSKGQLKAVYKQIAEICDFIDNDTKIQQYLSGDEQTIMVGEIGGAPFKIKIDSYLQDKAIVDLKVMWKITDKRGNYIDFISQYGYDVQLACYQEIVRQNTGLQLPCYIVVVTKESPINSAIIHIPQDILDKALYSVEDTVKRFYDVKMGAEPVGCGVCSACIEKRTETPLLSMKDFMTGM